MFLQRIRCADIRPEHCADVNPSTSLEALAESIRRHGVLRPVLLRATADGYVVVHGERRLRAARIAGLEAIPACLVEEIAGFERRAARERAS